MKAANDDRRKRVQWIDIARGILIILVVIGHVIGGFLGAGLIDKNSSFFTLLYYIYSFHMPAFFALSGLLAPQGANRHPAQFLRNTCLKILYPYFLWSIVQAFVITFSGNLVNHPATFGYNVIGNVIIDHVSQFWFLKALFLLHVIYFLSRGAVGEIGFFLTMLILRGCVELFPMQETIRHFASFGIFYALGTLFAAPAMHWPERCRSPILWAIGLGVIWAYLAYFAMLHGEQEVVGQQLRAAILPASITGSLFIFALSGIRFMRYAQPLAYLGRHSMSIFLLHVMFVAGTRILMVRFLGVDDAAVIFPLAVFDGVAGPVMVYEIAKRLRLRGALGLN
jgi:fucose 4-O-acetylase-like acetyltransferase